MSEGSDKKERGLMDNGVSVYLSHPKLIHSVESYLMHDGTLKGSLVPFRFG